MLKHSGSFLLLCLMLWLTQCTGLDGEVVLTPVGNEMKFEQTEFTVRADEPIHLTFNNTATSPAMSHNVVILNTTSNDVADRIGVNAIAAVGNDYIPDDEAILAYTPLVAPGESAEITFTAPSEPGDYRYLCTFPGHYILMQGIMKVVR